MAMPENDSDITNNGINGKCPPIPPAYPLLSPRMEREGHPTADRSHMCLLTMQHGLIRNGKGPAPFASAVRRQRALAVSTAAASSAIAHFVCPGGLRPSAGVSD